MELIMHPTQMIKFSFSVYDTISIATESLRKIETNLFTEVEIHFVEKEFNLTVVATGFLLLSIKHYIDRIEFEASLFPRVHYKL